MVTCALSEIVKMFPRMTYLSLAIARKGNAMAMNYARFEVTGKHASPEWSNKTYIVTVHYSENEKGFFCDASELGCSRTYQVFSASHAVDKWLHEHGYYLVKTKEIDL